MLHISGCRLTQTPRHTCKWQKEKIKGKTFLLPSLLPISHTLPTLKAARDQDPKSRCQLGFKLWSWERHSVCRCYWPYGFAKRPHLTSHTCHCRTGHIASHKQSHLQIGSGKLHSLRFSSSQGMKLCKRTDLLVRKGQRLKLPSPMKVTQEFNFAYASCVVPWLVCLKWQKGILRERGRGKRQEQISA